MPGSVTLLGGEPGVGKSTLLLQALASVAERRAAGGDPRRATGLYVTAEESARQVALRAARLGVRTPSLWLVAETALPHVVAHIDALAPDVVVVDSIQTVHDPELGSAPGSVGQVRGCAQQLVREAKARGTSVVLVGHVTKDGGLAGPRVLEHMVDTVLSFEGERHHALRMLRAVKHRFGGTHELGLYEMGDRGLVGVPDPSALFLADRQPGVPGSVVAPVLDGQRSLLVEVQALVVPAGPVAPSHGAGGRRRPPRPGAGGPRAPRPARPRPSRGHAVAGGVRVPEPGSTWPSRWRWRRRPPGGRCRPTWSPAARSAWVARCGRCTAPTVASPRRPGSASPAPSCPARRPSASGDASGAGRSIAEALRPVPEPALAG